MTIEIDNSTDVIKLNGVPVSTGGVNGRCQREVSTGGVNGRITSAQNVATAGDITLEGGYSTTRRSSDSRQPTTNH